MLGGGEEWGVKEEKKENNKRRKRMVGERGERTRKERNRAEEERVQLEDIVGWVNRKQRVVHTKRGARQNQQNCGSCDQREI